MKILFLDVDGVLNSQATWERRASAWSNGVPKEDDEWKWPLGHLDTELVVRLNSLVEATNCSIVLSSSWRTVCKLDDFQSWITTKGFKYADKIISKTPDLEREYALLGTDTDNLRGNEIKEWLSTTEETVDGYVIYDDDAFDIVKIHPKNFVHIHCMEGLQERDITAAIKILNPTSLLTFT